MPVAILMASNGMELYLWHSTDAKRWQLQLLETFLAVVGEDPNRMDSSEQMGQRFFDREVFLLQCRHSFQWSGLIWKSDFESKDKNLNDDLPCKQIFCLSLD